MSNVRNSIQDILCGKPIATALEELLEMTLSVKHYEQTPDGERLVATHLFHGDTKADAIALSRNHRRVDRFYAATGEDGEGDFNYGGMKLKLRSEKDWINADANLHRIIDADSDGVD